ncbi:hypothetical protein T03_13573, partial [Trichinella britovi]
LSEWLNLSNLPVADQCEERTFTIDVLIGLDYYFNLVGDDVRRDPADQQMVNHCRDYPPDSRRRISRPDLAAILGTRSHWHCHRQPNSST